MLNKNQEIVQSQEILMIHNMIILVDYSNKESLNTKLELKFGSELSTDPCLGSFGVDDIEIFVAKYSNSGNLQWSEVARGQGIQEVNSMVVDSSNSIWISTTFEGLDIIVRGFQG